MTEVERVTDAMATKYGLGEERKRGREHGGESGALCMNREIRLLDRRVQSLTLSLLLSLGPLKKKGGGLM